MFKIVHKSLVSISNTEQHLISVKLAMCVEEHKKHAIQRLDYLFIYLFLYKIEIPL